MGGGWRACLDVCCSVTFLLHSLNNPDHKVGELVAMDVGLKHCLLQATAVSHQTIKVNPAVSENLF